MFYACVRRFDVIDTVQKILGTKHGLRQLDREIDRDWNR